MKSSLLGALFISLVCVLVVFSVSTNSRNSILVKEYVFVAAGGIAGLLLGVLALRGASLHLDRVPALAAASLALLLILMLLAHFLGPVTSVNGPFTIAAFVGLCLLGAFGVAVIDAKDLRIPAITVTVVSFIVFLYAMLQARGVSLFPWDAGLTRSGRSSGSLGNPNLLGAYAAAMIPFGSVTILTFMKKGWFRILLAALFSAGAAVAIVTSGTRGSLLGVAGGTAFMVAWLFSGRRLSQRGRLTLLLSVIAIGLIIILPMRSRITELLQFQGESGTARVRMVIWDGGFQMFRERPVFGWGPGSFQIIFPGFRNPRYSVLGVSHNTLHAHCEYLEILCDIGLAGLLLWAVFIIAMARRMKGAGLLGAGAAAGAFSMLGEGLVSVSLRWPPTAWLFGFLCMTFLIRGDTVGRAPRKGMKLFPGAGISVVSLALCIFCFTKYPDSLESARLVFAGKDNHLTSTETPMSAAGQYARAFVANGDPNAALAVANAWSTATVHADSAIVLCVQAAGTDETDLSALYALGSAYLTRAILSDPLDRNITAALANAGYAGLDPEAARRFNELGMEALARLCTMAPNYAETHNNMAIGYLALGRVPESLEQLYLAWKLHSHRRQDYFDQSVRLVRLVPESRGAALLIWNHMLEEVAVLEREGRDSKTAVKLGNLAGVSWFLLQLSDSPDSLRRELSAITSSYGDGLQRSLDSISERVLQPDELLEQGCLLIREGSALEGLALLERLHVLQNNEGSMAPSAWPGLGAGYRAVADAADSLDWGPDASEALFRQMVCLFVADRITDVSIETTYGALEGSVRPGVRDTLFILGRNIGGPRAASRALLQRPWLEGSMLGRLEASLEARCDSCPDDPDLRLSQTRFYFLAASTMWWDSPSFNREQNDYLLTRLFACRDSVAAIMGSAAPAALSNAIGSEIERVAFFLVPGNISILEELKRDLVGMVPRSGD